MSNRLVITVLAIAALFLAGCSFAVLQPEPEPVFVVLTNDSKLPSTSIRSIFYAIRRIEVWNYGDSVTVPVWTQDVSLDIGEKANISFPSGMHYLKVFVGDPVNAGEFNSDVQAEAGEPNMAEISSAINFDPAKMYIIKFDSHKEIVGTSPWSDLIMTIEVSTYE